MLVDIQTAFDIVTREVLLNGIADILQTIVIIYLLFRKK